MTSCRYEFDPENPATLPDGVTDPQYATTWSCPLSPSESGYCAFHAWVGDDGTTTDTGGSGDATARRDPERAPEAVTEQFVDAASRNVQIIGAHVPELNLRSERLEGDCGLVASVVDREIDARRAVFEGETQFVDVVTDGIDVAESRVTDRLLLNGSRVDDTVNLLNVRVEKGLWATGLTAGTKVVLKGGTVEGSAFLGHATYGRLNCIGWTVDGELSLRDADVNGRATLTGIDIGDGLRFEGIAVDGPLKLDGIAVAGAMTLEDVDVAGAIRLELDDSTLGRGSVLDVGAQSPPPSFRRATLRGVRIRGGILRHSDLRGADLTDANLDDASLRGADLEGAVVTRTNLHNVDFEDARTYGAVFTDAKIDDDTVLPTETPYESEGDLRVAADAHRELSRLARQNSIPEAASEHYLKRKRLMCRRHREEGRLSLYVRALASDFVVEYGENPYRVVATAAVIVVASGLLYPLGLIERANGETLSYVDADGDLLPVAELLPVVLDSLYFSTVTFTTLGFGDFRPVGYGRVVATLETSAGVVLLALLVFVFGRRATR